MTDNEKALVIAEKRSLAWHFAASGYFDDTRKLSQAVVKIVAGRELGLGPMASVRGIRFIEGEITLGANVMAVLIRRSGLYDYEVVEWTDDQCVVRISKAGKPMRPDVKFTIADAKRAGVMRDKSGWTKYPRNMLFARAISDAFRLHCPELAGGAPIYNEGDWVEGEQVEIPEPPAPGTPPPPEPAVAEPVVVVEAAPSPELAVPGRRTAKQVIASVQELAASWASRLRPDQAVSEGFRGLVRGKLGGLFGDPKNPATAAKVHSLVAAFYGVESTSKLTQAQLVAINDWMGEQPSDATWDEAQRVVTHRIAELGQQTLFGAGDAGETTIEKIDRIDAQDAD